MLFHFTEIVIVDIIKMIKTELQFFNLVIFQHHILYKCDASSYFLQNAVRCVFICILLINSS